MSLLALSCLIVFGLLIIWIIIRTWKRTLENREREEYTWKTFAIILFITFICASGLAYDTVQEQLKKDTDWCDYDSCSQEIDSCSQEIYKWDYNGSVCFDSNNSECQDFLRFWTACQDYKNRLGVC